MGRKKILTPKMITAMKYIANGETKRQAMIKAGYSVSAASNPKHNLLDKPQVLNIIDQMKLTLEDEGVNGKMLALKLAKFAQSDNPKVFFRAYDRIGKVVGIEPNQSQLPNGLPKRQVTFTEWATGEAQSEKIQPTHQEDNLDDLISLDKIKIDKSGEVVLDTDEQERQPSNDHFEASSHDMQEVIY